MKRLIFRDIKKWSEYLHNPSIIGIFGSWPIVCFQCKGTLTRARTRGKVCLVAHKVIKVVSSLALFKIFRRPSQLRWGASNSLIL